jgi:hypothetical protein
MYHKSGMWKVCLRFQRDTQTAIIGDKTLQIASQTFISILGILYICRLVTMITHNASLTELRFICAMAGRLVKSTRQLRRKRSRNFGKLC